ncbi:uncharacterized protein LOC107014088 [Solanum pennellii]|uniref:Uncharacterized protein LOC107014088 n=1 Tax=Solanum pennellii TaxID=28526 RepID=A0ABM1GD67_SOLPN|nr:uncharacterized protein LOC107014088 [Solanum pennellii]
MPPSSDYCHCRCGTRVAFLKDYISTNDELNFENKGIFTDMFNVEVPENDESYHQVVDGKTLVDTFCCNCRNRLGRKFIAVPQGCRFEQGQFLVILNKLSYTNGHDLDPYEEDLDQDGEVNVDQAGGPNDDNQDGGPNVDNQDGGRNDDNQDEGANEENAADNQLLVPNNGHIGRNGNI